MITMDPDVAAAFRASTKVSRKYLGKHPNNYIVLIVAKGVSANLMQVGSKRRRTKRQIEEDREEAIRKEEETVASMAELAELRARMKELEEQAN